MVMDKIRRTTTRRTSTTTVTIMTGGMDTVAKMKKTANGSMRSMMTGTGMVMRPKTHNGQNLDQLRHQMRSKVMRRTRPVTTREKAKEATMVASTAEANGTWLETVLWETRAVESLKEKASTDGGHGLKEKEKERADLVRAKAAKEKEKDLGNAIGSANPVV